MKQNSVSLYPKISSIYNKILQLAIAVILVILLLNLAIFNNSENSATLEQHFDQLGHEFLLQNKASVELLLRQKNRAQLRAYIEQQVTNEVIASAHLYSHTGQLIASSNEQSINQLYNVGNKQNGAQMAVTKDLVPFVLALGKQGELGYLRFNLNKEKLLVALEQRQQHNQQLLHLLILLAGFIGFLLTRGFARFSRQGFRASSTASMNRVISDKE